MRILVVDDDARDRETLARAIARGCPGAHVSCTGNEPTAPTREDIVVLGPGSAAGPEAVRQAAAARPEATILVLGRADGAAPAVDALRAGASDYLVWRSGEAPTDLLRALERLGPCATRLPTRAAVDAEPAPLGGLIGTSPQMQRLRDLVRTAARTEAAVLIEGETGTGKELVARAVHALGRRAAGPFVPLNCAAVPESLAESEFFGHARGAFTGALQERPGVLQLADRGTVFLDEIEDLPLSLQAKLLRVVQDREVRPLGGSAPRRIDVRIVAASNRDLAGMVERGEFRRDLYYRLRVLTVALPPLRERREDVPLLVRHFVMRFNARHGTTFAAPSGPSLRPLLEHHWPGNVRELENTIESLLVLAGASDTGLTDLLRAQGASPGSLLVDERARILRALEEHRWNRQRAAAALGISRVTLWRRMGRHGIRDEAMVPSRDTG
jgi:two-component system NtrC family response regulator